MSNLLQSLSTARDLALVMLGFGFIVFIHELGHFLAARWAGIRVMAFAVGFGPAVASFRKGRGIRLGSGEVDYLALVKNDPTAAARQSTTEYRFNILPLGGYVKMLGQEDANPLAVSDAPDSYQNCKPWKRMVVISAGVIMNLIMAAVLFIGVFMVGLPVEPAKVGAIAFDSPAGTTMASNAAEAGVTRPGLQPSDELLSINGRHPNSFNDLILATAMTAPNETIDLTVRRPGVNQPLTFNIKPQVGKLTGLLEIGVGPSHAPMLATVKTEKERVEVEKLLVKAGFKDLKPGMKLVRIGDNKNVTDGNAFDQAARESKGTPFEAEFASDGGKPVMIQVKPTPAFEVDHAPRAENQVAPVDHLLGLTGVMRVTEAMEGGEKEGLKTDDIFARIGNQEYPNLVQGMAEIKAHPGKTIAITVLRKNKEGVLGPVALPDVKINSKGQIGFIAGDTRDSMALVSLPPQVLKRPSEKETFTPAAVAVISSPGTRIVSVDGHPVGNFGELRASLIESTKAATAGATVTLAVQRPSNGMIDAAAPVENVEWKLAQADIERVRALGWDGPPIPFELDSAVRKAASPSEAIGMGLAETRRVMLTTYVTFARLVQGTVKVEHLKGPVGIAHLGTMVANRGPMQLLFFMALISVNLAVINFMPLPIVDGGQFLFLVYEQVRGKPVPMGVQNAVTMVGLVLIGSMFLIVTYNDITHLFG